MGRGLSGSGFPFHRELSLPDNPPLEGWGEVKNACILFRYSIGLRYEIITRLAWSPERDG